MIRANNWTNRRKKPLCIVVTGGPGSGKTTGIEYLQAELPRHYNIHVMAVPEAARVVFDGGAIRWSDVKDRGRALDGIQRPITRLQRHLRILFVDLAREYGREPCVVVCDRGELDGYAYNDAPDFAELLTSLKIHVTTLLKTYDAVIHMRTPATAWKESSTPTETQRDQGHALALELDRRVERAWDSHPNRVFISETPDWETKRRALRDAVRRMVMQGGGSDPVDA